MDSISKLFDSLMKVLDRTSAYVSRFTFNYGHTLSARTTYDETNGKALKTRWVESLVLLAVISALAVYSRVAQFDLMAQNPAIYFLPGLLNVSTTHDAGFFMLQASQIQAAQSLGTLPVAGQLLPYLIALAAHLSQGSLEEGARYVVYISTATTSCAIYLLFAAMRQQSLGFIVGCLTVFIWPIAGRTGVGVIDTELLNLAFFSATLALITFASTEVQSRPRLGLILSFLAGISNYLLYLNYYRPGFTLAFLIVFVAILIIRKAGVPKVILFSLTFLIASGPVQIIQSLPSLVGFLSTYLGPLADLTATSVDTTNLATGVGVTTTNVQALFFGSINEIQKLTAAGIRNDYGSVGIFVLANTGLALWLLSDWRRLIICAPLLIFLALYLFVGLRFGYYAAPLLLAGIFVAGGTILAVFARGLTQALMREGDRHSAPPIRDLQQAAHIEQRTGNDPGGRLTHPIAVGGVTLVISMVAGLLPTFPRVLDPVIYAHELTSIRKSLGNRSPNDFFLVAWWDYGYELRYQTRTRVITDGADPANIRNVYLARALTTMNPLTAADEYRFATYFSIDDLRNHFPTRPPINLAKDTNDDIYIFLPSDHQHRMFTIFQIAARAFQPEELQNYNPKKSSFYVMASESPQRWGPFELVFKTESGAVLYRLPGL